MKPEEWRRIRAVFDAALDLAPESRPAFLDESCAGDAGLRDRVERLLAAHEGAGRFGEEPVAVPAGVLGGAGILEADGESSESTGIGSNAASDWEASGPPSRTVFAWTVRAALVATVGVFAYGAFNFVTWHPRAPYLGWGEQVADGAWVVSSVDPAGPAAPWLRPGDEVVGFAGGPLIRRDGTSLYRRMLSPGDSYRLSVEREGARLDVTLPVGEGPDLRPQRLYYYALALVWCMVGLFIGLARPDIVTARLAFAASWVTGFVFLDWALLTGGPFLHPLHVLLGYHFFCRFPTGRPARGPWRWSLGLLYAVGAISIVLGLFLWHARLEGVAGMAELANRFPEVIALRAALATDVFRASLVLMVLVGLANHRRLQSEDQRRRVRWLVFGAVVGLTPQVIWMVAELALGIPQVAWMRTPANLFTLLVPVAAAYAVVKHRVFEIKVVVRRGLQYLLARRGLQAAVVVPVGALVVTLVRHRELTLVELVGETRGYLLWMLASGVVLSVRTPLQRFLDRRFFREQLDREQLLLEVLEGVRKVESISELAHVVHEQLVTALHPTAAHIWYRDPEELALASSSNPLLTPADVPSGGAWVDWLERHGEAAGLPLPSAAGLSRSDSRWFIEHGIGLLVPIVDSTDRMVGVVMLGEKRSEEPYSAADTKLLSAVARQAAVVRENLRLRARVGEEVRVRHEVLSRLDARIPDLLKECPSCGTCFDGADERCPADGHALALTLPVRRTIESRYRLDRLLGKGGMGAVYRAHDLKLEREVAVKVLLGRAFGRQDALRRFRREARTTARMSHANIVTVYDYGTLEGQGAYLVMELLAGTTLRAELDRRRALPPVEVAAWLEPVLAGVTAAHAAGIVHRDLKPENVMGVGQPVRDVKILDLGLAKLQPSEGNGSASMTTLGLVMGTLAYMAPEQLAGRQVDARTDVFSLGVMLTEMLTGRKPLSALDLERPLALARWTECLGPSPTVAELDTVVRRCVETDPAKRFANVAALGDRILPLLRSCPALEVSSEPVRARAPGV